MMGEVTVNEFNGLGNRVNNMAVEHAQCRGMTMQRLEAVEARQGEHRGEIKELYTAMDKVRLSVASLKGQLIGMGLVLSVIIPIATTILTKTIFK